MKTVCYGKCTDKCMAMNENGSCLIECEKESSSAIDINNVAVVVDGRVIPVSDIKDVRAQDPAKHGIQDMEPYLAIELNSGERVFTENEVKLIQINSEEKK